MVLHTRGRVGRRQFLYKPHLTLSQVRLSLSILSVLTQIMRSFFEYYIILLWKGRFDGVSYAESTFMIHNFNSNITIHYGIRENISIA